MGGFGFGFGFRSARPRQIGDGEVKPTPTPVPVMAPSEDWTGVAGSGFASVPVDPARVTAKAMIRLLVPPNQYYTDELLVGVIAGANDSGSLFENLGLRHVIVHYEGTQSIIFEPSFQTFPDANGVYRTYYGWWAILQHDGRNGHCRAYFEAVPRDPSMQSRVMGPYQFSPQAKLHDHTLEVAKSQTEIAGRRYKSTGAAMAWLRYRNAQNPLITITEGGTYDFGSGGLHVGNGYCTIEAVEPVTFAKPAYVSDLANYWRTSYNRIHLKGKNITLDYKNSYMFYSEGNDTDWVDHWLDGVNITKSGPQYELWRSGMRLADTLVRGYAWFTECKFDNLHNMGTSASLARGCEMSGGYSDIFNRSLCVVGCIARDHSDAEWRKEIPALMVEYTGASTTATIEMDGYNDRNGRAVILKENGKEVARISLSTAEADWKANGGYGNRYFVHNVVDWINGREGWSATLADHPQADERRATYLSAPGATGGGAFSAVNVKNKPFTLVTMMDIHSDWYQKGADNATWTHENIIIWGNQAFRIKAQNVMIGSMPSRDWLIGNNAWHNTLEEGQNFDAYLSQFSIRFSHMVFVHNTWASQQVQFRDLTADSYCLFANNTCIAIHQNGSVGPGDPGNPYPNLVIADNHIHGFSGAVEGQNTTTGGERTNLFSDPENGDFRPAGALLTAKKPPVLRYDLHGTQRPGLSTVGAVAG